VGHDRLTANQAVLARNAYNNRCFDDMNRPRTTARRHQPPEDINRRIEDLHRGLDDLGQDVNTHP